MAYTDIDKPSDYFNTKLYTGTGGTQAITGVGFQPDWVWLKARSSAYSHQLFDVVRGATKLLSSEETSAEQTLSGVTAFGSDGFTVGSDAGSNNNTTTFASWNWKAGTSFTNDASSTGIGSIDSSGSVSDASGFSIVSYTGTGSAGTIKHGLSSIPKMILVKDLDNGSYAWHVYTAALGNTKTIYLNLTNTPDTNSIYWNNTTPTSSVFSVGSSVTTNNSGDRFIAYCFAEKQGYSKVGGSYTGNGNADGTFVYTGQKSAFVMIKRTDSTNEWLMFDNKRSDINVVDELLRANNSAAELTTDDYLDITAQGFKIRRSAPDCNASGGTYIYMCFASNPFVSSTGVPACAR